MAAAAPVEVSRAAEDKLTYKLGLAAEVKCAALVAAYNACADGRTISAAWACRSAYAASQACIRDYVNRDNIEALKQRWVAAGRPQFPDWPGLMAGIVAPEHMRPLRQRVALDLYIGSRAPDAVDGSKLGWNKYIIQGSNASSYSGCMPLLDGVFGAARGLGLATLTLHYVGAKDSSKSPWYCRGSDAECEGNIQQLCVQSQARTPDQRFDWAWAFALCQASDPASIGSPADLQGRPLANQCLRRLPRVPLRTRDAIRACMFAPDRLSGLYAEFEETSRDAPDVTYGCSLRLEGQQRLVRARNDWVVAPGGSSDAELLGSVCAAYRDKNGLPQPPPEAADDGSGLPLACQGLAVRSSAAAAAVNATADSGADSGAGGDAVPAGAAGERR
ncbi:hypothetical protein HT031_002754 [Scenedesmus sp. PABB004]|nr:hypothetical protein HT031_002754 [Scenedesmus sp. PABB004]